MKETSTQHIKEEIEEIPKQHIKEEIEEKQPQICLFDYMGKDELNDLVELLVNLLEVDLKNITLTEIFDEVLRYNNSLQNFLLIPSSAYDILFKYKEYRKSLLKLMPNQPFKHSNLGLFNIEKLKIENINSNLEYIELKFKKKTEFEQKYPKKEKSV